MTKQQSKVKKSNKGAHLRRPRLRSKKSDRIAPKAKPVPPVPPRARKGEQDGSGGALAKGADWTPAEAVWIENRVATAKIDDKELARALVEQLVMIRRMTRGLSSRAKDVLPSRDQLRAGAALTRNFKAICVELGLFTAKGEDEDPFDVGKLAAKGAQTSAPSASKENGSAKSRDVLDGLLES